MSDPVGHCCAGHPCDHCYLCDVIGICCMTVSTEQRARLEAHVQTELLRLRQAIICEAAAKPSLAAHLRSDMRHLPAAGLLAPAPLPLLADPPILDQRRENVHVLVPRTTHR
jgi:hypothetical protein